MMTGTGVREVGGREAGAESASPPVERWGRLGLCGLIVALWAVAVFFMWDALTTIPSAERLEDSRLVAIPTPRTFFAAAAFSAMELAVILVALWPGRPEYYASRLGVTTLVMITWFVTTTPMELSRMDWVHRRWLAVTIVVMLAGLAVLLGYRLVRRLGASRPEAVP